MRCRRVIGRHYYRDFESINWVQWPGWGATVAVKQLRVNLRGDHPCAAGADRAGGGLPPDAWNEVRVGLSSECGRSEQSCASGGDVADRRRERN